eukprot:Colp12_sorted_trinity150504_noHs@16194
MMALFALGRAFEHQYGSVSLLVFTACSVLMGSFTYLALSALITKVAPNLTGLGHVCTLGFSGVIFTLLAKESMTQNSEHKYTFFGFSVPAKAYPWVLLVLVQIIVPDASLLGHLSGILVGYLFAFVPFVSHTEQRAAQLIANHVVPKSVSSWKCYHSPASRAQLPVTMPTAQSSGSTSVRPGDVVPFTGKGFALNGSC